MRLFRTSLSVFGGLSLGVVPAFPHHSFMAEFDQRSPVRLEGVVMKVEWLNPHTYFYVDVKDQSGQTVSWALETEAPVHLSLGDGNGIR